MDFETWVKNTLGLDPASLTPDQRNNLEKVFSQLNPAATSPAAPAQAVAAAAAERSRIAAIENLCDGYQGQSIAAAAGDLKIRAIAEGLNEAQVSERLLALWRGSAVKAGDYAFYSNRPGSAGRITANHLAAGIMVRAGFAKAAERNFGPTVLQQARDAGFDSMHLLDMMKEALRLDGKTVRGRDAIIRAGFSNGSMPIALGSSADKILIAAYQEAPAPWRSFAAKKEAPNFRQQSALRPTFPGNLRKLGGSGEVKHGTFGEEKYNWQLGTFAEQLKLSRTDVRNDDLGIFDEILPALGKAAARTLNDLVASVILNAQDDSGNDFWTAGRGNYLSGGTSPLSATSLATAIKQMREMRSAENAVLDLVPEVLLVGSTLEPTARALIESTEVLPASSGLPTGNVNKGVASLVVDPRISGGVDFEGVSYAGSTTAWYLFSSPANASVVVGFLDGVETPTTDTFGPESDIDSLAFGFRIYHDFGAALGDYRASQKSAGA